jgi:ABC-2 type transport system permease protein
MNNIVIIAKRELRKKLVAKAALVSFGIMVIASAALPWVGHLTHPSGKNDYNFQYAALSTDDLKIIATAFNNKFILTGAGATFSQGTSGSGDSSSSHKNYDATLIGPIDHLQIKNVDSSNTQFNLEISAAQTQIFQSLFLQRNLAYQQTLQQFLNTHSVKVTYKGKISTSNYPLAMADSILLYTLILLSSSTLALGVVEEKANKVIEILLSAIKPKELLLGKILGLSIFALLQFIFLGVTSTLSSHFAGANYFHGV